MALKAKDDEFLLASIRSIMKEELKPINANIALIQEELRHACQIANDAKSMASDALKIAEETKSSISSVSKSLGESQAAIADVNKLASQAIHMANRTSNTELKQTLDDVFERSLKIETFTRRNNLKLLGVAEKHEENILQEVRQVLAKMECDPNVQISACHRLGPRKAHSKQHRPIMIRFICDEERASVWSKRRNLKDTNIVIQDDYPPAIEQKRKILWPYLTAAFEGDPKNPDAKVSAFMVADKLMINNQTFNYNDLDRIPEYIINRFQNSPNCKKSEAVTVFFSVRNMLSNFFPAPFVVKDIPYNCAEQYISQQKALLFNHQNIAEHVMQISDPKMMKQKVKRLKGFDKDKWIDAAGDILKTALLAKFSQNDRLKNYLLFTGSTQIGEASPSDSVFGIGLSLRHRNVLNPSLWKGANLTGQALMDVRHALQNI